MLSALVTLVLGAALLVLWARRKRRPTQWSEVWLPVASTPLCDRELVRPRRTLLGALRIRLLAFGLFVLGLFLLPAVLARALGSPLPSVQPCGVVAPVAGPRSQPPVGDRLSAQEVRS